MRFTAVLVATLACTALHASGPIEEGCVAFHAGDLATAKSIWQPLAAEGDARAQFGMAMLAEQDDERMRWATLAAGQGHPEACFWMYRYYWTADPPNKATALEWLEKSANNGFVEAAREIGGILRFGTDVPRDCSRAMHFLEMGANLGSEESAWWLGGLYGSSDCGQPDVTLQAHWYRRAARMGHPLSAGALSAMYYEGRGVPQDYTQSVLWAAVFDQHLEREDLPSSISITVDEFDRLISEAAAIREEYERRPPPRCP